MDAIPRSDSGSDLSLPTGIRALATGGTWDCDSIDQAGTYHFNETHLPQAIRQARLTVPIAVETIILKDSALMAPTDRRQIVQKCQKCSETKIIICHGTDTMILTLQAIARSVRGKTIVAFGAFVPYVQGTTSDALANFGAAVVAVQLLPPGVYLTAHGHVSLWDRVEKDYERQEFKFLPRPGHQSAKGR